MGWKEQLQPASFRGVKFKVDTADVAFGRRNQVHEYPGRDEPFSEDLGKKAREYRFNAYILGENYFSDRDALIKAIEGDKTSGVLVHPTLGRKNVVPRECSVNWSNREGGIEFFTLVFVEAGEKKYPTSGFNLKSVVGLKADGLISTVTDQFERVYKVTDFIEDVANQASNLVSSFFDVVDGGLKIGSVVNPLYSAFRSTVDGFRSTLSAFIPDGSKVGANLSTTISGLSGVFATPKDRIRAQTKVFLFGQGLAAVVQTTPSRVQKAKNQAIIVATVRALALAEIAVAVTDTEYASKQDAVKQRDEVVEMMDQEILDAGDNGRDDFYTALEELRTAVVKEVSARAINLPNLRTVRNGDHVPALAFAYNLYEDAERDQEIVDRNHIRNPLFVPGNTDIEVLT